MRCQEDRVDFRISYEQVLLSYTTRCRDSPSVDVSELVQADKCSWPKSSLDLNVAHGWTSELEDASACLTNARANLQDRELTQRSSRDVARRRRLEGFGVVLPDT